MGMFFIYSNYTFLSSQAYPRQPYSNYTGQDDTALSNQFGSMNLNQPQESTYSSSGYTAPQQQLMGTYSQPHMPAYSNNYLPVPPMPSTQAPQTPSMPPASQAPSLSQYPQQSMQQLSTYPGQPPMPSTSAYQSGFPPMGMMPPAPQGPQSMMQKTQSVRAMADGMPNAIEVRLTLSCISIILGCWNIFEFNMWMYSTVC